MTVHPVEREPPTRAERIYLDPMDDAPDDEYLEIRTELPAAWYPPYDTEDLEIIDGQLRAIYGDVSWERSQRARAQTRLANGRFATAKQKARDNHVRMRKIRENQRFYDAAGRLRDGLGRFAKPRALTVPRPYVRGVPINIGNQITWDPMTITTNATAGTIRVYRDQWDQIYPNYVWQPTGVYTQTTTMTGGTMDPGVWRQWHDAQRGITYIDNGTGTTPIRITDEAIVNRDVYAQWNVIADRDRVRFERDEEWQAREAERRQRERDEMQQRREAESRRRLAREQFVAGAQERALELLKMVLSPEEHMLWEVSGVIHVRGSEGGLYEIHTRHGGVHGNIEATDEHGCQLGNLCVAPRMVQEHPELGRLALPLADGWVGQYLTIKNNEGELLRHANWSRRRQCQQPGIPVLGRERQLAAG